jgi:hypothetical protein
VPAFCVRLAGSASGSWPGSYGSVEFCGLFSLVILQLYPRGTYSIGTRSFDSIRTGYLDVEVEPPTSSPERTDVNDTADRLQALYDSTPDARLVLVEGELVLDVPEKSGDESQDDVAVVVVTRAALMERLQDAGGFSRAALEDFAPVVDDIAAKLGA